MGGEFQKRDGINADVIQQCNESLVIKCLFSC